MKNYIIKKEQPKNYANWKAFVSHAKKATFLFHRDFMEYHSDRFEDFSLVILDGENGVAIGQVMTNYEVSFVIETLNKN